MDDKDTKTRKEKKKQQVKEKYSSKHVRIQMEIREKKVNVKTTPDGI